MEIKEIDDAEYERLKLGYEKLLDWVEQSNLNDREVLGLLMKASMSLATFNEIPKREVLGVISFLYDIEKTTHPTPAEVH